MSKNVLTFDITMDFHYLSKSKAKDFKSLAAKKQRDISGLFLAEGHKCVSDYLGAFPLQNLVATREWCERNPQLFANYADKILISDKRGLEIISSLNSVPDVIAVFEKRSACCPEISPEKLYLLLDEIQDPGNLGTIIRTCDWFGVYDIFASPKTVDLYSPKVVQATMGSLSRVRVHYVDLKKLVENHPEIPLVGTLLSGIPYKDCDVLKGGCFVLMGNEGRGISEDLKKLINVPVTIPPANPEVHPDSLNVAIATAVILSANG